jgi:DNA-binding XRE family transcriptional regulator
VQIADIEAGRSKGSIDTMRKLADTLRVTIDDLV